VIVCFLAQLEDALQYVAYGATTWHNVQSQSIEGGHCIGGPAPMNSKDVWDLQALKTMPLPLLFNDYINLNKIAQGSAFMSF
jgi:hypothetical protein